MNELKNFDESFRKNVAYDNIKSHKIPGSLSLSLSLSLSGENTFLEKPQGKVGETITKQSPQIYSRKIYIKEYPLINGAQKCTVVMFISKNPLFVSHSTRPCIEEEPLESPKP